MDRRESAHCLTEVLVYLPVLVWSYGHNRICKIPTISIDFKSQKGAIIVRWDNTIFYLFSNVHSLDLSYDKFITGSRSLETFFSFICLPCSKICLFSEQRKSLTNENLLFSLTMTRPFFYINAKIVHSPVLKILNFYNKVC